MLTYHINGDLSNFGGSMFLTELPDFLLLFWDFFLENAFEVGRLCAQTS